MPQGKHGAPKDITISTGSLVLTELDYAAAEKAIHRVEIKPDPAVTEATTTGSVIETFDLSGAPPYTFEYQLYDKGVLGPTKTLTCTLTGAAEVAADVGTDLTTLAAGDLLFEDDGSGYVKITGLTLEGGNSGFKIITGTLNAILGFTDNTLVEGTGGTFKLFHLKGMIPQEFPDNDYMEECHELLIGPVYQVGGYRVSGAVTDTCKLHVTSTDADVLS